jgi:hypothetical protein
MSTRSTPDESPEPLTSSGTTSYDPLARVDPFAVLADARFQLLAAIETLDGGEPERVAAALGAVVAYDDALGAIARASASGDRTFEGVATPLERAGDATTDDARAARARLFESLGASGIQLDVEVLVPWAGTETWQLHLIGLAMHEGAQAQALRDGDPLPRP